MAQEAQLVDPRRVALVTDELLGYIRTGGIGTATTFLAIALARIGHDVEVLYYGRAPEDPIDPEWARLYEHAGVRVRMLPERDERVEPPYFERMRRVELALRTDPPDVVVVQDLGAPAYTALRLKQLGLGFESTLFVVFCHGTRRWITEMARKVRVLPGALAVELLEQASVELADVAVSPSAYMLDWMRRQRWRPPEQATVIPLLTRSGATGEPPPARAEIQPGARVERLVFFGRLEERKGLRPFAAGLNMLDPKLLDGVELEFLGRATPAWSPERVEALISETARSALAHITFETELDQHEALARLSRPGTLAVMPSLEDNSPNAVYECLERGIPFIASNAGGPGELIDPEDRAGVLCEPTAEGVAAALGQLLSGERALEPARPAFDNAVSRQRWAEVVALRPREQRPPAELPPVDVIVMRRGQAADVPPGASEWVVCLDEADVPAENLVETLVRAQAASGADVVTCGITFEDGEGGSVQHFFAGDPGGLGVLGDGYGSVALLRRSLLDGVDTRWPVAGDWPLLARLSASGARVVSVPVPLVTRRGRARERDPGDALLVVEHLERELPDSLRSVVRLAAGLAAESQRSSPAHPAGIVGRARHVLRDDGFAELARRTLRRIPRGAR